MNYILHIFLAIIEQIIIMIVCKGLASIKYEEISYNYSVFRFRTKDIEHYGINMLIRIFFPVAFIIVVSGILYNNNLNEYVKGIYLVTLFFYLCRWIFITLIQKRALLHYWRREFICFFLAMLFSIVMYSSFIIKTEEIFIPIDSLRDAVWFAIISLFVALAWNYYKSKLVENEKMATNIRERYICTYYNKLKKIYKLSINNKRLKLLTYSIMIYENYNRPPFFRLFEYIKCLITGSATMGIMQVKSEVLISNKESVRLGTELLKKYYEDSKHNIRKTINKYNRGNQYFEEVMYIYNIIKKYNK